ncbi:hypothetical protein PROSTU_00036 [Providencia stuartii ATCC 25827]|uniref:Uncharacterized protein n=1 Tax=Providencia stuartii ATCC 25827 TaxID=471874 RepID=A0AA86YPX2_PROST|nr:hypothetical protein PROSTU_00036 [Providencia stuartii ATCC 25827]
MAQQIRWCNFSGRVSDKLTHFVFSLFITFMTLLSHGKDVVLK